jgi:hypothetical protein
VSYAVVTSNRRNTIAAAIVFGQSRLDIGKLDPVGTVAATATVIGRSRLGIGNVDPVRTVAATATATATTVLGRSRLGSGSLDPVGTVAAAATVLGRILLGIGNLDPVGTVAPPPKCLAEVDLALAMLIGLSQAEVPSTLTIGFSFGHNNVPLETLSLLTWFAASGWSKRRRKTRPHLRSMIYCILLTLFCPAIVWMRKAEAINHH